MPPSQHCSRRATRASTSCAPSCRNSRNYGRGACSSSAASSRLLHPPWPSASPVSTVGRMTSRSPPSERDGCCAGASRCAAEQSGGAADEYLVGVSTSSTSERALLGLGVVVDHRDRQRKLHQ